MLADGMTATNNKKRIYTCMQFPSKLSTVKMRLCM